MSFSSDDTREKRKKTTKESRTTAPMKKAFWGVFFLGTGFISDMGGIVTNAPQEVNERSLLSASHRTCYNDPMPFGKSLIVIGICLVVAGLMVHFKVQVPWLGKLPGDILIRREGSSFYFPVTTCLLISILVSFLLHWFRR